MKKLIFNSDDFGNSIHFNEGVKRGYLSGMLTSTCIMANGPAFDDAIENALPLMPNMGLGAHLNIIEGKSLTNPSNLVDYNGIFNNGFLEILSKSNDKKTLSQIEREFRAQIEKILDRAPIDHINSHVHTHSIPSIFEIASKLTQEYGIKYIRSQSEKQYFVPSLSKHLSLKYPPNIIKNILLNAFSTHNKKTVEKFALKTNDYLVGVLYTGYMDEKTVEYGLRALSKKDGLTEILIHPSYYDEDKIEEIANFNEYKLTQSERLKTEIEKLGFEFTNYRNLNKEN